jgi:hypothetical protein
MTTRIKRKFDINEIIEKRKKITDSKNNDDEIYYELIKNNDLNSYIFKDDDLMSTLKTYYLNKLTKIDEVGKILMRKNKMESNEHWNLTRRLQNIREEVVFENSQIINFCNQFKKIYNISN